MKKRSLALLLVLIVIAMSFLTGCGGKDSGSGTDGAAESGDTAEEAAQSEDTAEEPAEADDDTEAHDLSEVRGVIDGNKYTNEFYGIAFQAPDDQWVFADEEYLSQLMGAVSGTLSDEDLQKAFENSGVIFDVLTYESNTGANINITLQDIGVVAALVNEDTVLEGSIDTVKKTFDAQGYTNTVVEKGTTTFLGSERGCIVTSGDINGVTMHQRQVYIKKGRYLATITATTVNEDNAAKLLEMFTAL